MNLIRFHGWSFSPMINDISGNKVPHNIRVRNFWSRPWLKNIIDFDFQSNLKKPIFIYLANPPDSKWVVAQDPVWFRNHWAPIWIIFGNLWSFISVIGFLHFWTTYTSRWSCKFWPRQNIEKKKQCLTFSNVFSTTYLLQVHEQLLGCLALSNDLHHQCLFIKKWRLL